VNILVINQDWFVEDWRKAGHSVITMGIMGGDSLDIRVKMPMLHVDRLLELLPKGWKPDRIVIHDNSGPVLISGLEETSIPVLFYSVDTHHHFDLHTYYAHLFDEVIVAQRDYLHYFDEAGVSVSWMPLWASRYYEPSDEKRYGAVFVGGMDPKLNPERVAFLSALKNKVDIHQQMGEYWKIFPHAEVVLNQTVKRDLNFRVFEGMMSGSLLLTENTSNGLLDLFTDGVDLLTYEKGNVDDAAAKINWALNHKEEARKIAAAGRRKILEQHLSCHRAALLLPVIEKIKKRNSPIKYGAAAINYSVLAKRFIKLAPALAIMCASEALKAAGMIRVRNEPLTDHVACYLISSAMTYDRINHTDSGQKELFELYNHYPDNRWLRYAAIRWLLNFGRQREAEKIASVMPEHSTIAETFADAEKFILGLADVH
jgi:hypothetical protein